MQPRAVPGTHTGSSMGLHSTSWYRCCTFFSHSLRIAVVLSMLWSVAALAKQEQRRHISTRFVTLPKSLLHHGLLCLVQLPKKTRHTVEV